MNQEGSFVASLLDASPRAYAAGVVLRLQESGEEGAGFVERFGFQDLVRDVETRLQHLSASLSVGRPELFVHDMRWLASVRASRGVQPAMLRAELECWTAELEESLPPEAAALARQHVEAAIEGLGQPVTRPEQLAGGGPQGELLGRFLQALLEGRRAEAVQLATDALEGGLSYEELHDQLISRAQVEVGRMWEDGEVNVAEEHLCSHIVEDVLAIVRSKVARPAATGRCVLTASVAGNLHEIGARIVADHFELRGWRSVFLGANTPRQDIVRAARAFGPDLVALSVGRSLHLKEAAATIGALRAEFPDVQVLVGGPPFAVAPELWRELGASACAQSAQQAIEEGERLVAG